MNDKIKSELENTTKDTTTVVPYGFVLMSKETLERLKDFEVWKEWIHNPEILEK